MGQVATECVRFNGELWDIDLITEYDVLEVEEEAFDWRTSQKDWIAN